jgi:predicted O-methyltransferase YrrM
LSVLLGLPTSEVDELLKEAESTESLQQLERRCRQLPYAGIFRGGPELFVILRAIRPRVVLETGVGLGYSSTYILEALRRNQSGRLLSIDLPNADANWKLPSGIAAGGLVPPELTARWELRLGPTRDLLPPALAEISGLDLFLHDSQHTYDTMMFEYLGAYAALSPQGLLISDDAMWNPAMLDFASRVGRKIEYVYHRGGGAPITVIRKGDRAPVPWRDH